MKFKFKHLLFTLLVLFINLSVLKAGCSTCARTDLSSGDYIVQCASPFKYDNRADSQTITVLLRQNDSKPVFCLKHGANSPAYGAHGIGEKSCSTTTSLNSDSKTNSKLQAAIGYIINRYHNSYGDKFDYNCAQNTTTAEKIEYYAAQIAIHKILAWKNSGTTSYNELSFNIGHNNYDKTSYYTEAQKEFNAYLDEELKFNTGKLTFTRSGSNFVSNQLTITNNYLNDSYSSDDITEFTINGVSASKDYVSFSSNKVTVTIPVSALNSGSNSVSLKISKSRTYHLAYMKTCGTNLQPIAENATTDDLVTKTASASGDAKRKDCEYEFTASDKSMNQRVRLYRKYSNSEVGGITYGDLRNMLNKSITDETQVCTGVTPAITDSADCLIGGAEQEYSSFTKNNMSNYTIKTTDTDGNIVFCATKLKITTPLSTSGLSAKSGMLFIKSSDGKAVTAKLYAKCYAFDSTSSNPPTYEPTYAYITPAIDLGSYTKYINVLGLTENDVTIDFPFKSTTSETDEDANLSGTADGTQFSKSIDYTFNKVYAENGSGKLSYYTYDETNSCQTCKFLGYGIPSKLNTPSGSKNIKFKFSYSLKGGSETSKEGICTYTVTPEIVKNEKLQLEFRSVDVYKPFLKKSGNSTRTPKKNWSILTTAQRKKIFEERPNSYGIIPKTGATATARYTIILTPQNIRRIRQHIKDDHVKYDDYDMDCNSDGSICISNYLTDLCVNNTCDNSLFSIKYSTAVLNSSLNKRKNNRKLQKNA